METVDSGGSTGGGVNRSIVIGGALHVFRSTSEGSAQLRHYWNDGTWHSELLATNVGDWVEVALVGARLHVFFLDDVLHRVEHIWRDGNGAWSAIEHVDGPGVVGGNGRTSGEIKYNHRSRTAFVLNGIVHIFYAETSGADALRLRHATLNGSTWSFEAVDGLGVAGGNGRIDESTGRSILATAIGQELHVWYVGTNTGATLRHAWQTGGVWQFESFDGPNAPAADGVTTTSIGATDSQMSFAFVGGRPYLVYTTQGSPTFRYAWRDRSGWHRAPILPTIEGAGFTSTALEWRGQLHIWFDYSENRLKHAWLNGSTWSFEELDGVQDANATTGRTNSWVGPSAEAVLWGCRPHVVYDDVLAGGLRRATIPPPG